VPALDAAETRRVVEAHPAVGAAQVGGIVRMLAVGDQGVPVKHLLMLLEMAHDNCRHVLRAAPHSVTVEVEGGARWLELCSPYRGLHVRRESEGGVRRSRVGFCRPVPNPNRPFRNSLWVVWVCGRAGRMRGKGRR
jgi:hypothetical protein